MTEHDEKEPVVVLGGTGRVGSAVVDELAARDQAVVVVSRRPRKAHHPLVQHRPGDAHALHAALQGVRAKAVIVAVTPFTAPPSSFDGFDGDFYVRIIDQLQAVQPAGSRVIYVAVTAIARLRDGSVVADHDELFPARLRPFSDAHARGADRLAASNLDGTVVIPAAGLGVGQAKTAGRPVVLSEPITIDEATADLDHVLLARAVVDQLNGPDHTERLVVRSSP